MVRSSVYSDPVIKGWNEMESELSAIISELRRLCLRSRALRASPRSFLRWLDRLRDRLATLFALEDIYTRFHNRLPRADGRPLYLTEQARVLKAQHQKLYREICAILDRAEDAFVRGGRTCLTAEVAPDFERFCEQLQTHERLEDELIPESFDDDLDPPDELS